VSLDKLLCLSVEHGLYKLLIFELGL
jgi:hypothetical protein